MCRIDLSAAITPGVMGPKFIFHKAVEKCSVYPGEYNGTLNFCLPFLWLFLNLPVFVQNGVSTHIFND
jgi:hypothetical protein